MIWADNSTLLNRGHLLMTVNVLYDRAVFYTNKEMEGRHKGNIAVQPLWNCHKFTSCHHVVHHKLRTTSIILKNAMQGDLLQKEIKKHLEETRKKWVEFKEYQLWCSLIRKKTLDDVNLGKTKQVFVLDAYFE